MNFGRILNIFIVLFLVANILLFVGYQYKNEQKHTLSTEREVQLKEILGNNNIYIYCLLPTYKPRRMLNVELKEVDENQLLTTIFGDDNSYLYIPLEQRWYTKDKDLFIYKGSRKGAIAYNNTSAKDQLGDFDKHTVEVFGESLMKKLTLDDGNMQLTSSQPDDDYNYYQLEYNDVFKKEIIFSSYTRMTIYKEGRVEAKSIQYKPIAFKGERKKIVPVDEVLYRFMYNIRGKENNEFIKIMGIDIGYYVDNEDLSSENRFNDRESNAVPCYRISLGSGEVHYIDAYSNKEINYTKSTYDLDGNER